MAKWSGEIGFIFTKEEPEGSGIHKTVVEVKHCVGDVVRASKRWQEASEKVSSDITLSNQVSIVATPYLLKNFYAIRFISFMGSYWSVNSVAMDYPRLTLEIGGVYNGDTTPTTA